ncbi:ANTAR domain-containing protein [Mycobacterium sp. M23085]|uniref:GAF and ANTAR domain-containing protein n=1 Tax=Mycobacterium sp. M23085 TaxID=3378087 RepID=UPI0038780B9E
MLSQGISSGMTSAWSMGCFADSKQLTRARRDDAVQSRIAELADALVGGAPVADVLAKVACASIALVPGTDFAKISVIDNGQIRSLAATSSLTALLDTAQRTAGQGPCLDAISALKAVRCDDLRSDVRWPQFAGSAATTGVRSVLSCPVRIPSAGATTLSLFGFAPNVFSLESEFIGAMVASHAATALVNDEWTRQFKAALATRDVIGQAKGMIMGRFDVDASRAFAILKAISQQTNTPVRDLACEIVESQCKHHEPS